MDMKLKFFVAILSTCEAIRLSELKLPSRNHVKYMPAGYKDDIKTEVCPSSSSSSSGSGLNTYF